MFQATLALLLLAILILTTFSSTQADVVANVSQEEYIKLLKLNKDKLFINYYTKEWFSGSQWSCEFKPLLQKYSGSPDLMFALFNEDPDEEETKRIRNMRSSHRREFYGDDENKWIWTMVDWVLVKNGQTVHIVSTECNMTELEEAIIKYRPLNQIHNLTKAPTLQTENKNQKSNKQQALPKNTDPKGSNEPGENSNGNLLHGSLKNSSSNDCGAVQRMKLKILELKRSLLKEKLLYYKEKREILHKQS